MAKFFITTSVYILILFGTLLSEYSHFTLILTPSPRIIFTIIVLNWILHFWNILLLKSFIFFFLNMFRIRFFLLFKINNASMYELGNWGRKTYNAYVIALIPKKVGPEEKKDFRPMSSN